METYARNFVRVALVCLLLGFVLGLGFVLHPALIVYRPLHVHLLLLGFMCSMVFGIGYHIVPRFQGHAIIPRELATLHFHLATWGLLAMLVGWVVRLRFPDSYADWPLVAGAFAQFAGAVIFVIILMRGLIPARRQTPGGQS